MGRYSSALPLSARSQELAFQLRHSTSLRDGVGEVGILESAYRVGLGNMAHDAERVGKIMRRQTAALVFPGCRFGWALLNRMRLGHNGAPLLQAGALGLSVGGAYGKREPRDTAEMRSPETDYKVHQISARYERQRSEMRRYGKIYFARSRIQTRIVGKRRRIGSRHLVRDNSLAKSTRRRKVAGGLRRLG